MTPDICMVLTNNDRDSYRFDGSSLCIGHLTVVVPTILQAHTLQYEAACTVTCAYILIILEPMILVYVYMY